MWMLNTVRGVEKRCSSDDEPARKSTKNNAASHDLADVAHDAHDVTSSSFFASSEDSETEEDGEEDAGKHAEAKLHSGAR